MYIYKRFQLTNLYVYDNKSEINRFKYIQPVTNLSYDMKIQAGGIPSHRCWYINKIDNNRDNRNNNNNKKTKWDGLIGSNGLVEINIDSHSYQALQHPAVVTSDTPWGDYKYIHSVLAEIKDHWCGSTDYWRINFVSKTGVSWNIVDTEMDEEEKDEEDDDDDDDDLEYITTVTTKCMWFVGETPVKPKWIWCKYSLSK